MENYLLWMFGEPMKVLIADDSPGIRVKIQQYLKELGHEVVGEASTGHEALNLCKNVEADLCLLDIVMPGMDGLHALERIKKECPNMIVVIISSAATTTNMLAARKAGAADFVLKPFKKEKLADLISRLELSTKAA